MKTKIEPPSPRDIPEPYSPEVVLELIGKRDLRFHGYLVRMSSDRYYTFRKGLACAHCGIEGQFFLLRAERDHPHRRAHFNLWAVKEDGSLVMMTKDHIVPAARGGKDRISNYQTMCHDCNAAKGKTPEKQARENRKKACASK